MCHKDCVRVGQIRDEEGRAFSIIGVFELERSDPSQRFTQERRSVYNIIGSYRKKKLLETIVGAAAVVQWVEPWSTALASHVDASSSFGCSTSSLTPC